MAELALRQVKEIKPSAGHVLAIVKKPFIGTYDDDDDKKKVRTGERRYANAQDIIVAGFHHPIHRHMTRPHVIELTPLRFKILSAEPTKGRGGPIVVAYDPKEYARLMAIGRAATDKAESKVQQSPPVAAGKVGK